MPFAARNDDGWRLCRRKGPTIFFIREAEFGDYPIEFRNQQNAKACADDLNEWWDDYWTYERSGKPVPYDIFTRMLDAIVKHDGLSKDDQTKIMEIHRAT